MQPLQAFSRNNGQLLQYIEAAGKMSNLCVGNPALPTPNRGEEAKTDDSRPYIQKNVDEVQTQILFYIVHNMAYYKPRFVSFISAN